MFIYVNKFPVCDYKKKTITIIIQYNYYFCVSSLCVCLNIFYMDVIYAVHILLIPMNNIS